MLPINKDILNTADFFRVAFTLVLALAITESFKQFIADKAEKPEDRTIHWNRLPALTSFLLLALPFFHGMSRYFFIVYTNASEVPRNYGAYLLFDGIAFLSMSAMFFAMSRALSAIQWRRYFYMVLVLLVVDSAWIIVAVGSRGFPVQLWLILNSCLAIVLIILLLTARKCSRCNPIFVSSACAATVAITTSISYFYKWEVFFPSHNP
jgi:hypothetical protein